MLPKISSQTLQIVRRSLMDEDGRLVGAAHAARLSVSPASHYRWRPAILRDGIGLCAPPPPATPYEALPEERATVRAYALKHPAFATASWPGGWSTRRWS